MVLKLTKGDRPEIGGCWGIRQVSVFLRRGDTRVTLEVVLVTKATASEQWDLIYTS